MEPLADFSVVKQCRNFEGLLRWVESEAVEDQDRRWGELRWEEGMPVVDGDGYL